MPQLFLNPKFSVTTDMTLRKQELSLVIATGYTIEHNAISGFEWDRLIADFNDATAYQTYAYSNIRMKGRFFDLWTLKRDGKVVSMAAVRVYRIPYIPIGVAQLTLGPVWRRKDGGSDIADLRELLRELVMYYCKCRGLRLKVTPPMYECEELAKELISVFEKEGFTAENHNSMTPLMLLTEDIHSIRKKLEQKWRNRLNAAERHGLHVTVSGSIEDFDRFTEVYFEMRRRKQYKSSENVPQFGRIFAATEETIRPRVVLCWKEANVLAGAVISTLGDTALYLYGATSDDGLKMQAANLVHWSVVKWAKENALTRYDLVSVSEMAPWFKRGLCAKNGIETCTLGPFVAEGWSINTALFKIIKK